ncbi:GGDEF domain-containing protein [Lactococcus formosensis]|uniref:GGDEF domain-containing protein n=1 Tax=Lactococcus formosensis TaxID=1281486 RepID=UPI0032640F3B
MDAFKHINDTYGHAAGDYTLKEICELVRIKLKNENTSGQLFRYGGDEFFIIFRNNREEEVKEIIGGIVDMVSTYDFKYEKNSFKASISVGAVEVVDTQEQQEIINDVDKKLYIAKSKGKNQVVY